MDVQFVEMCILCGCDYLQKLDGIGPVTAYRLITTNGSMKDALTAWKAESKKGDPNLIIDFERRWPRTKKLFIHPNVTPSSAFRVRQQTWPRAGGCTRAAC